MESNIVKPLLILMIEKEQPEGLSARKLVVETAKHNVITAYNRPDGLALFHRVPNVDALLIHALLLIEGDLIGEVRKINPTVPIIVASPDPSHVFEGANYVISSHSPQDLIKLLNTSF